jgi:hypothetical protein
MQVDAGITKCAVFIGFETERGFYAEGSGFMLRVEEAQWPAYYVVTARHVVASVAAARGGIISIRLNRKDQPPLILSTDKTNWIFHKDTSIDIAIYNFDVDNFNQNRDLDIIPLRADETDYSAIMTPAKENFFGVNHGDEVFMVSVFVGRIGERKNIPVIRIGNIAALPEEPVSPGSPKRPAYLIETRSLGGTSGAPVFLNLQQFRTNRRPSAAENLGPAEMAVYPGLVIAMIIGSHGGPYLRDFVSEEDTDINLADGNFNAGISVALPISLVMEVINSPELIAARHAYAELLRANLRPSS